jgi:hypothetical protein
VEHGEAFEHDDTSPTTLPVQVQADGESTQVPKFAVERSSFSVRLSETSSCWTAFSQKYKSGMAPVDSGEQGRNEARQLVWRLWQTRAPYLWFIVPSTVPPFRSSGSTNRPVVVQRR